MWPPQRVMSQRKKTNVPFLPESKRIFEPSTPLNKLSRNRFSLFLAVLGEISILTWEVELWYRRVLKTDKVRRRAAPVNMFCNQCCTFRFVMALHTYWNLKVPTKVHVHVHDVNGLTITDLVIFNKSVLGWYEGEEICCELGLFITFKSIFLFCEWLLIVSQFQSVISNNALSKVHVLLHLIRWRPWRQWWQVTTLSWHKKVTNSFESKTQQNSSIL